MKDKTKSILIAVSFIIAMLLFVWGFNFLKGKSLLKNQFNFYAVYDNSKGLLPGDLVTINGMQVGTVSALDFHPSQDGSIVVEFTIGKELNIPDNSVVELSSSMMGAVSLNIRLGDSKTFAQNNDTLNSNIEQSTMSLITETLTPLKDNLDDLVVSLNDLTTNLNDILNSEFKKNINDGANSFASSMDNIETISTDLQQLVDSEDGKLTMVVNNLETITDNFTTVSDSLMKIDYNQLVSSLENCVNEFNTLLSGINNGEGSAGLLVKNDSLYNNVNETVATLQYILEEIKKNPKKIKLSVF